SVELAEVEARLRARIGQEINLDSPKQLGHLLYSEYRMPIVARTKTGAASTGVDALLLLRSKAKSREAKEFLDDLLARRKLSKLKGTYLGPFSDKHRAIDGRVHTTFYIGKGQDGGTVTGRLSSAGPNLQNMPRDNRIRGIIGATPGTKLFDADYSQ